jgi:branched-chain amino acid transport system ATP-binding protein
MADVLSCEKLCAGWGETQVLSDVTITLPAGESLSILGRNGVGKSTLLATIMGRATYRSGSIKLNDVGIERLSTFVRAGRGLGYVPQEREIFPSLSVRENLLVAARPSPSGERTWTLERVLDLFPRLGERLGNGGQQLSGGEQQMLSIGRALMGNPDVILLDEPMEGLAPVIVEQLLAALTRIRQETRLAVLLVEQHVDLALEFSDRVVVMDRGQIVYDNAAGLNVPDRQRIEELAGLSNIV